MFSEILVIFCLVYQEACVNCSVRQNIGWSGAICGVNSDVFLFVIKLFLNCCCSIDVLYCFSHFYFILRSVLCV